MTADTKSTDPLVAPLARRLRQVDLVAWHRITMWAERSGLSFEDLRVLLALAQKSEDGPVAVRDLGELAGLSLDVAYPTTHSLWGRGYLRESQRRYALSERGEELIAEFNAAHREGVEAYVQTLDQEERERLLEVFAEPAMTHQQKGQS